jgi:TonB-dependent SusC/RagA subfamily outer membrane receptor
MKKIFLILILLSTSISGQNYDKNWLKVIEYENEGKIKSANEVVLKIHQKASRDNNEVQILKCFFYESKYLQVLDEDAQTKIINNLKTEINKATIPSKAILHLVYAKCLIDYQKQNSYLLYNRTNTVSFDDQFLTWTSKDISEHINCALEKTLLDEAILKQTSLNNYLHIFDYNGEDKTKKDNLFNYLVKENIALYTPQIRQWEIQKKEFLSFEKELLGNSASFLQLNFDFVKNEKLKKVLELYQKQERNAPDLENQFDRIQFCNSVLLDSDDSFMKSLNLLQKKSTDLILTQKIQFEKAVILNNLASKEIHPDYNIKAVATLDSIIKSNNRSNAHKLALQKKQNISSKSLNIQLQKFSYTYENTRAFIRYKNLNRLSVSFFKIDQNTTKDFRNSPYNKDSLVAAIIKDKKPIASKNYELEKKNNYFEYSTEVLLPPLKTGSYLVYFESDSDIKNTKAFAYETITISNITALASQDDKKVIFQVLDRKTGKPLENVSIALLNQTIKTGKNGVATHLKENKDRSYRLIEFTTKNDSLLLHNSYSRYNKDYATQENEKTKGKVEFYLDRAIYRPGQTVYYKGIACRKEQDKTTIIAKTAFKIIIKDPNSTIFKKFDVITNEYGSFSGEFTLPKSGLTGNFRMKAEEPDINKNFVFIQTNDQHQFWDTIKFVDSEISFKVEEYKRPKFEVRFDAVKKEYQVNRNVNITGLARAFAGSNISDAKVTYKVTLIPYTLNNGYYYNQNGKSESILVGETKTDATGKFEINFTAKPFENTSKEQLPIFEYHISASVTDSNGETHQTQTNIRIGYHSLTLSATIPNRIETKNKNEIQFNSTNLNGEFLAVKGEIKLYYVSPFSTKFKSRVFPQPEIETISKEDFERYFPYEYNNQPNAVKPTEILVFSKKIDTEKDKKLALDFISNFKSGNYKVVFSAKDAFENPIETISNFQLLQSKDKIDSSKLFVAEQINTDAKKDGFVLVKLTSVIPELYINTTGNYQSFLYFENTFHLQNNETIVKIPLKKEFEKSMKIGFESIFENQTFDDQIEVILKEEESKLEFTVESFRNKIQPGNNENWSFQLKTFNTSKEAEVLASMYDSSLDQFAKRDWNSLKFNNYNYNPANFKTSLGFDKTSSYIRNLNPILNRIDLNYETTKLIWFGFNFNDSFTTQQLKEYQKQLNNKSKKPLNAEMISGIVSDGINPLPGAQITVKGIERGTQTDFDGFYQIEAATGEELTFSYIGFETQKITIDSNIIDVQLEESSTSLEEVVIVGYESVKKKSLNAATPVVVEEADNQIYNTAGIEMKLEGKASGITIRGNSSVSGTYKNALYVVDGEPITEEQFRLISPTDIIAVDVLKGEKAAALYGSKGANGVIMITTKKALEALTQVKARKNLSESAFFYPNLKTDSKGKVSFNFTSPEALTAWKLRLLAHNKEAVSGYLEKSVITQKELMVTPNFPRFFREKDSIVITAKVANITNEAKTGIAVLQLFDATTMQSIDAKMGNANTVKNFKITPFGNTTVSWKIYIPEGLQGVQYKVLAKAGNFSDGEENILPILTNNMLVTESIPIWVRENSKKEYTFENLKNNSSTTLRNHQFTLEYTSNPSWLAIQSLPYLMEYEHESAEQTFARFYANALASEIISSNPKIENLFETWRKNGKLNSKLEENEELKAIILAETPWLNDSQNEEEKKKNLALLFDLEKMKNAQETTFDKLKQKQISSGGFAWFEGSTENEYITRHILSGLGHLSKLSNNENTTFKIKQITATGIPFLDQKFLQYHKTRTEKLKTNEKLIWFNPHSDLHYLYTRSFYLENNPLSDTLKKATKLYLETAKKDWLTYSLYEKGLAALTLNRFGEKETAKKILESLKETASNNEDWGMYWIANKSGWHWYKAPIETQALLIEAFAEIGNDTKSVDAMKVWLLKNKQSKNWPTTKSTTEAIYALLMQGTDWLSVKDNTIFKIGTEKILTNKLAENEKESEAGYVKLNWKAEEIKKEMATISIENKSKVPGFGGVYWQYFEELDKIKTNSGTALSVSKELYAKKNTDKGEILERINSNNPLKIGDLVTVRLVISAKEDMEFVHLKDMRASCFEPVDVLSAYQYRGELGFYKSTKDAATHFFFDQINKGTYVLEYDARVNNSGDFSNGITTIQSMYAPEFSSHTKGIRIKTSEK